MRARLLLILLLGTLQSFCQSSLSCNKIPEFKKLLDAQHINPEAWNQSFTTRIIDQLFSLIDARAMYFSQEEETKFINNAAVYQASLAKGECQLIRDLAPVYQNALARAEAIVRDLQRSSINVNQPDTFRLNFFHESFYPESQLKTRWRRVVTLGVLLDVTKQGAVKDFTGALDKNCRKNLSLIKRRRDASGGTEYLLEKLMNAIATSYDPHTTFFSKNEKQSFLDDLSTDQLSFGLVLQDDALGNVTIGRIIPGSAAWDVGTLHEDDIVVSVRTSPSETIDASLYSAEEIETMLAPLPGPIDVSVKKINGDQVITRLEKQRIRKDENKIKSLVLSNSQNRFGYVNLPVFFTGPPNKGCASELAKEIIQLKKAKIEGLILDLRNNGGGNLEEAILLSGIFIDRGAIAIIKNAKGELETLRDVNAGVAYDGPLLIMVNGGSASASELFAAAMRVHHRALLVGSPTYGKGTGQTVMSFEKTDLVKITSFRFYDPTGKSHQGKGLLPDIVLPDFFSLYDFNESHKQFALIADSVNKKTYFTPLPPLPIDILRDSSQQRVMKNSRFNEIQARITKQHPLIDRQGTMTVPLTLADIGRYESQNEKNVVNAHPVADHYVIKLTSFDQQIQGVDKFETETFRILIDEVAKDPYIDESLHILKQYLTLQKK